jgi:hypothetical protein
MARLLPGQRTGKKLPDTGFVEAAQEAVCGKAMRQSGPVRELTARYSGGGGFLAMQEKRGQLHRTVIR